MTLNRLYAAEAAGLFRFLINAQPTGVAKDARLLRDVHAMAAAAAEQTLMLERLLSDDGVEPRPAQVPAAFAFLHDVSASYLLPRLIGEKQQLAALYDAALEKIGGQASPDVRAFLISSAARHRGDRATLEGYRKVPAAK